MISFRLVLTVDYVHLEGSRVPFEEKSYLFTAEVAFGEFRVERFSVPVFDLFDVSEKKTFSTFVRFWHRVRENVRS